MLKCLLNPFLRKSLSIPVTFSRAFSTSKCLFVNYYDVLKLNPNASQKEIKEAYFKLSKQNHPDLNQNDPTCHDRFIKLQEAYKVLSNPISRKEYDMRAGAGRRESYYHKDARRQPDFSARDEWIRQQNERMQREMRFGAQFGQRYDDPRSFNSYYSRPQNMSPEEMKKFLRMKRVAGQFNSFNFILACLFMFVMIIMSESLYVNGIRQKYYEDQVRKNAQLLKEAKDPFFDRRSWELRSKMMNELRENERREAENMKDNSYTEE